jgi:hypothetical protein
MKTGFYRLFFVIIHILFESNYARRIPFLFFAKIKIIRITVCIKSFHNFLRGKSRGFF